MTIATIAFSVGVSFFFLVLVFRPIEWAYPAKPGQRFFRPAWLTDLCFFLGQYLVWNGLVLGVLFAFGDWLDRMVPGSKSPGGRRELGTRPVKLSITHRFRSQREAQLDVRQAN